MNLQQLRKAKGLTQQKLSELSGVSQNYISELENGAKQPTLAVMRKLALVLEVTLDELAGYRKAANQ